MEGIRPASSHRPKRGVRCTAEACEDAGRSTGGDADRDADGNAGALARRPSGAPGPGRMRSVRRRRCRTRRSRPRRSRARGPRPTGGRAPKPGRRRTWSANIRNASGRFSCRALVPGAFLARPPCGSTRVQRGRLFVGVAEGPRGASDDVGPPAMSYVTVDEGPTGHKPAHAETPTRCGARTGVVWRAFRRVWTAAPLWTRRPAGRRSAGG